MPKLHVKPTKEELDKGIQDALDELDKPVEPLVEEKIEVQPEVVEETAPEAPAEVPEAPAPEDSGEIEKELKKKLANSAREAQILQARTKKYDEAVNQAAEITEVTDEEAVKIYPEWDLMDDTSKMLAKDSIVNRRRFELIHKASMEGKDIQEWQDKVDTYLGDPKTLQDTPEMEGKEDDFKVFATKPTRRGLDFDDLTKAFLYDVGKMRPKSKGQMFPTGSGGPNDKMKPKSDKISLTEARQLMKNDYNKYKELLMAGKIDDSEI